MKIQHDLRNKGNIPTETLDYLANKRAESKGKNPVAGFVIILALVLLTIFLFGRNNEGHQGVSTAAKVQGELQTTPSKDVLNSCDIDGAKSVLASAAVMAEVNETDARVTYRFHSSWWSTVEPKVKQLMAGVADADACVGKTARLLTFQDPSGKEIGVADPVTGFNF